MTSKAALFALLAMWGVGFGGVLPTRADDSTADSSPSETKAEPAVPDAGFVNRVWVRADGSELSGVVRVFLSDGTLVQDSSWEAHRLSNWKLLPDNRLSWNENGTEIAARIASLSGDRLVLVLDHKDGAIEEQYVAAPVPSVYPDLDKA